MKITKAISLAVASILFWSCSGPPDELTPYVFRYGNMQSINSKLERYQGYLKSPALERQARDIREVIQAYHDSLESFGKTKNKFIKASHNNVKRAVARALTQLVQPDFPTFTISAQKQITLIKERVIDHYDSLDKMWREAGKTEPFPLKWPGQ